MKHKQRIDKKSLTSRRIRFSASLILLTFTISFIISTNATQALQEVSTYQGSGTLSLSPLKALPEAPEMELPKAQGNGALPIGQEENSENNYQNINHTVKSGETLSDIIQHYGFAHEYKHILGIGKKNLKKFAKLKVNKSLEFLSKNQSLQKITYRLSITDSMILSKREDDGFSFAEESLPLEKSVAYVSASIDNSLYLAGKKARMSDKLIIRMANILGWDIDFAYDIRSGDYFTVIYEEEYLQGMKIGDGQILALHFFNDGKHHNIVKYKNKKARNDYYTLEGKSVRKAFLRSPLDFAYVSSHFNLKRMHPILHKVRAHKGVDYAAKRGTPIKAAGDGKVILQKYHGGYGKTVVLQHGRVYKTLYGHMSRFARKQRVGSYVKQGQVIGYVGSTGMSTGPHLHYEFHVNGVARNPLKVKLPDAKPLAKSEMPHFRSNTQELVRQLKLLTEVYTAELPSSKNASR